MSDEIVASIDWLGSIEVPMNITLNGVPVEVENLGQALLGVEGVAPEVSAGWVKELASLVVQTESVA